MLFVAVVALLPAVSDAPAQAETDTPMPPAVSRADIALYVDAFRAAVRDNWRHAHRLARRASDPLGATILRWWDYSRPGSTASLAEIARFMDELPDWPDQRLLQINAEAAMARGVSDADLIAWYHWRDPVSAPGRLRYADALLARGEDARAAALVRKAWVEGSFSSRELRETHRRYRSMLRPEDHIARLDRLVWANHARAARRMYRYVDEGHQLLAEARLTLRARQGGVDRAIERVPRELRDHPGLVYERLSWRRAKGRDDDARALLRSRPRDLGPRPKLWWRERAILARRALEDGAGPAGLCARRRSQSDRGLDLLGGGVARRVDRASLPRRRARRVSSFREHARRSDHADQPVSGRPIGRAAPPRHSMIGIARYSGTRKRRPIPAPFTASSPSPGSPHGMHR